MAKATKNSKPFVIEGTDGADVLFKHQIHAKEGLFLISPDGTTYAVITVNNDGEIRINDDTLELALGEIGIADVTGLEDALDDKADADHTHAIEDVTGLEDALDDKSDTGHTHELADITDAGTAAGLDMAVTGDAGSTEVVLGSDTRLTNARTPTTHSHTITDLPTSVKAVPFLFGSEEKPTDDEVLLRVPVPTGLSIPANFAGIQKSIGTNPTATATISVKKNGTECGTIAISTSGTLTCATTSSAAVSLSAGDVLTVVAPSTQDSTLAAFAISFVASLTA